MTEWQGERGACRWASVNGRAGPLAVLGFQSALRTPAIPNPQSRISSMGGQVIWRLGARRWTWRLRDGFGRRWGPLVITEGGSRQRGFSFSFASVPATRSRVGRERLGRRAWVFAEGGWMELLRNDQRRWTGGPAARMSWRGRCRDRPRARSLAEIFAVGLMRWKNRSLAIDGKGAVDRGGNQRKPHEIQRKGASTNSGGDDYREQQLQISSRGRCGGVAGAGGWVHRLKARPFS